jgi:hypothetical protein
MNQPGIFWLAFKPSDIATAKQFIDLLKGDSTVDVLGLTRTMESVSDILFPATSTLHKRIRYQIFIPAIISALYRTKRRIKAEFELVRLEYQLQQTLIASGEKYNVFGSSRGEALKYWPSTVYWASLNKLQLWGKEYLGLSEALELVESRNRPKSDGDEEDVDNDVREIQLTDGLDILCKNILLEDRMVERLRFDLQRAEAQFFRGRFLDLFPDSLTSYILKYGNRSYLRPLLFDLECPKNPKLNNLLSQARLYSCLAMGAYYAYRWALCRERRQAGRLSRDEEKANARHFGGWIAKNLGDVKRWQYSDLTDALAKFGGTVPDNKEAEFVEDFLRCAGRVGGLNKKLLALDKVLRGREENVKGKNRSHFSNSDLQVPKNTLGTEEYRDYYFDYRWSQGKTNLQDIFDGLKRR